MRKKAFGSLLVPLVLAGGFLFHAKSVDAFTDYSIYRVETGGIAGEATVKKSLQKLTSDTGWWATYEPTGGSVPYYQVSSGGFYGEGNVKEKINLLQSSTGFSATYSPIGSPEPYRNVVSGGFYGEENVKKIVTDFSNNTGLTATYEPTGQSINKTKIVSGGFYGEDNVKKILQDFKLTTGVTGTYESTGQTENYYQIVSGGFYGEANVKSILQNFISNTGINAKYEPTQFSNTYTIVTGGFVGEANVQGIVSRINNDLGLKAIYEPVDQNDTFRIKIDSLLGDSLTKASNYMDQNGWWYTTNLSNTKIPTYFRIVSEELFEKSQVDKALSFFSSHKWWATVNLTGQKILPYYRIVSSSLADNSTISKGMEFFKSRNWWATTQQSSEVYYPFFRVVTEPLLEKNKFDTAVDFFNKNSWWFTIQDTGKTGYTMFKIDTQPLLEGDHNKALKFFSSNGWWAYAYPNGSKDSVYKIVTGGFQGYENSLANAKRIADLYGWYTSIVLIKNGPSVMTTNYNLTLNEMLNLQMKLSPQTDKYRNDPAYVNSAYVDAVNNKINGSSVYVRSGPGTNYDAVAKLNTGFTDFKILGTDGEWTKISLYWKNAKPEDVLMYLDPSKYTPDSPQYLQFLKLSMPAGINIDEVNEKILNSSAGILQGTAAAFVKAAQLYNVNEIYLIAHALLETGYGTSTLSKGIMYNGQVVYNMYGYGAYDSCPNTCGAQKAFEMGWYTPEDAIIGGAALIGSGYIYNETFQQDTLYKMRWNPVTTYHQYATDVGWAYKQVANIYNLYKMLDNYTLYVDLPVYNK